MNTHLKAKVNSLHFLWFSEFQYGDVSSMITVGIALTVTLDDISVVILQNLVGSLWKLHIGIVFNKKRTVFMPEVNIR